MAYETLYRKYRPMCFSDVVGQTHITSALKNQLKAGKTTHAYLFCGTRGTGKTTTARIFARALSCLSAKDGEACGECDACSQADGNSPDIIEIDAASNSRVEETRDLLERVRFSPIIGARKVYIIDEVHMLSTHAFNALLKTLEEPPQHVVFILATTEPHKLLPTILSRCQRYDFRRVSSKDLAGLIARVLNAEGIEYDDEGLRSLSLAAEGSARDALSLTEQCLAFCGDARGVSVNEVLGSSDRKFMFSLVDSLIEGDPKHALHAISGLMDSGRDPTVFVKDASRHFRDILMIRACGDARSIIDSSDELYRMYEEQARLCSTERALRAIDLLTRCESDMRWMSRPRVLVEATLVRICMPDAETSVESALDRLSLLEAKLASGYYAVSAKAPHAIPERETTAEVPPMPDDAPPSANDATPLTDDKAVEIRKCALSAVKSGVSILMEHWKYKLDGNSFTFIVPHGTANTLLSGLNPAVDEMTKAVREHYPNVTISLSTDASDSQSSEEILKVAQNVFDRVGTN